MAHLLNWFAGSPVIALPFIGSRQTMVWRAFGTGASSGPVENGCTSCTRTTLYCRVFMTIFIAALAAIRIWAWRFADLQSLMRMVTGRSLGRWKARPQVYWTAGWSAWRQAVAFNVRQWWLGGRLMSDLAVSPRNSYVFSILRCGSGLPQMHPSFTSRKFWPATGDTATVNRRFRRGPVRICKTWRAQSKSGRIIYPRIPEHSWSSRAVAIGQTSH